MLTADQLFLHGIGDYVLQSDWMANTKTKSVFAALCHALTYVLPFLFLTHSIAALAVISGTHFVIDHWRLARYVCWGKNWLAPKGERTQPWSECTATGYDPARPAWLSVWLLIITDNLMHVGINALALHYLG